MPNVPVQIKSPDGKTLTVQKSSVPAYVRRGCTVVPDPSDLPTEDARKDDWVEAATDAGIPDARKSTKTDLIKALTGTPASPDSTKEN